MCIGRPIGFRTMKGALKPWKELKLLSTVKSNTCQNGG
jgi:hypothetical protein